MNMLAIFCVNYFEWTMKKFRDSFTLVDAVRGNLLISLTKPWSHPGRAGHYKHTTINRDLFRLRGSLYVKGSMQRVCECHFIYNLKTDTETTILEHDHNYHLHGHNHRFHDHGNLFYRRQWAAGFIGIFIDDLEMRPR